MESSSRASGGSLPMSPAVPPPPVAAVTNSGGVSRLSDAVSAAAAKAAVDEQEWNEDDLASFEVGGGSFLAGGGYAGGDHYGPRSPEGELERDGYGDGSPREEADRGSELSKLMQYAQARPPMAATSSSWHARPEAAHAAAQHGSVQLVDASLQAPRPSPCCAHRLL